jgi:hypothetical protein
MRWGCVTVDRMSNICAMGYFAQRFFYRLIQVPDFLLDFLIAPLHLVTVENPSNMTEPAWIFTTGYKLGSYESQ